MNKCVKCEEVLKEMFLVLRWASVLKEADKVVLRLLVRSGEIIS